MSMLQITLLGEPQICWANRPVEEPKGRSRALLFRLAAGSEPNFASAPRLSLLAHSTGRNRKAQRCKTL